MQERGSLPEIALAQMEVKPGRPDLNVARMLAFIAEARESGAEIIVFSELCVSGYILGDLWEVDALVEDFAAYSDEICRASEGLHVIFGNVAVDRERVGQDGRLRKYNAVYVCSDGQYVERAELPAGLPCGVQPKTLQPNYRFFDDDRHFFSLRHLAEAEGEPLNAWLHPYRVRLGDGRLFSFGVQLCEACAADNCSVERGQHTACCSNTGNGPTEAPEPPHARLPNLARPGTKTTPMRGSSMR